MSPKTLLRIRAPHEDSRVAFVELFFDLVFVFAVTQLSHGLLHHFTPMGLVQTAFLTLAVWWVWVYTTWATNWLEPQRTPVRLLIFCLMLGGLMLAVSIPEAFGARGLLFGCAYAAMQAGRSLFMCLALRRHDRVNHRNFLRVTIWFGVSGALWVAGGLAEPGLRPMLWGIALAVEYLAPLVLFRVPGLGRSATTDWNISGGHMAERCGLFIIIVLGESILVTGATFAELEWTGPTVMAFLIAVIDTITLWWIYFHIGAESVSHGISRSDDPGRIARRAYTYLHLPIVAGLILVAVGDELILTHPSGHAAELDMAALVGGPVLFLIGNIFFKRTVYAHLPLSHLVGVGLLIMLVPAYMFLPPVVLSGAATLILVIIAIWEHVSLRGGAAIAERPL
jgi:low temperature requirement protein LtrA